MNDLPDNQIILNGCAVPLTGEHRITLADFVRDRGATSVHLGCEHGVCGACTVIVDGEAVRSCLMLAVQADGRDVTTVEGISQKQGLTPFQYLYHWEDRASNRSHRHEQH